MKKLLMLAFVFLSAALPCAADSADTRECVLSFDAVIEVRRDASVLAREEIKINARHGQIRRGIVRVIPSSREHPVKVLQLYKDGAPHPYFNERAGQNLEINFGDDNLLQKGEHTYVLTYEMDNAVGFFKDYDEIYWNVTGNDWIFPIDKASVKIILPDGANAIEDKISTYTGRKGAKTTMALQTGPLSFETARPLNPGEGLTVAAPWQKGIIEIVEKPLLVRAAAYIPAAYALVVLAILIIYCFTTWKKVGKDPDGPVAAEYKPPQNISPALMRTIVRKGPDTKAFCAALISLVMKGRITITQEKGFLSTKTFLNSVEGGAGELPKEEGIIMGMLALRKFELSKDNSSRLQTAIRTADSQLANDFKIYFEENTKYIGKAFLIALCMLLPLPFLKVYADFFLLAPVSIFIYFAMFAPALICFCVYINLIDNYTQPGRELINHIRGFKRYMSIAEEGRVALSDPLDAERIFADYLPYAFALDMENKWFKKFEGVISAAAIEKTVARAGGMNFVRGRALEKAVNSARPSQSSGGGSRSGSGGGGFSGGGRGGGGGRGR